MIIYVNDVIIAAKKLNDIKNIIKEFKRRFDVHEMGEPKRFLGINIKRNREEKKIFIDQTDYIESALDRFGLANSREMNKLQKYDPIRENKEIDSQIIQQMLGVLQYLACKTRPDISYIVNRLSQEIQRPTEHLLNCVKGIFKYLKYTRRHQLILGVVIKTIIVNLEVAV